MPCEPAGAWFLIPQSSDLVNSPGSNLIVHSFTYFLHDTSLTFKQLARVKSLVFLKLLPRLKFFDSAYVPSAQAPSGAGSRYRFAWQTTPGGRLTSGGRGARRELPRGLSSGTEWSSRAACLEPA